MAESTDPKWLKWVAVTTVIFAVAAAISSIKSGGCSSRIGVLTTKEANAWNYYQAKSLKGHGYELQRDAFRLAQLTGPRAEAGAYLSERLAQYDKDIARYASEREQIKHGQELVKANASQLGLAVMFLQIAIMMSSVGSLVKQLGLWLAGIAVGAAGLIYMIVGVPA